MNTATTEFCGARWWQQFPGLLVLFLTLVFGDVAARAGSVTVSPSSGPGNALVTATASGFQPDATGTNYYNTGFYADTNSFLTSCSDSPGQSAWANCSVMIRMPITVGPHTITARNSVNESGSTTYTVAKPTLIVTPSAGPPDTHVIITGNNFAAAGNAGVYLDAGLVGGSPSDEGGNFTIDYQVPLLANGPHTLIGICGPSAQATFTMITNQVGLTVEVQGDPTITHPGGSPQRLTPGSPIELGDVVSTGPGDRVVTLLRDNTQFVFSENTKATVSDYLFDPNNNANNQASYNIIQGAYEYVSGLVAKKPDPNVRMDTMFGTIGIRGTQLIARHDPCSATQEVYLIEGELAVTPAATPGVTNIYDAPISIFLTVSNSTSGALTQTMYDSISNQIFQTSGTVTFPAWLVQHFGCTNDPAAAPHADPDGDGQDNYTEFLAGTDPTTNASVFRILSALTEGSDLRVTWLCGGGRTNVLQTTTNLGANWSDVSPNIVLGGSGVSTTNFLDAGAVTNTPARYYRVRLLP